MSAEIHQNPNLSFQQLYQQARDSMPAYQAMGEGILNDLRARHPGVFDSATFEMAPIKTEERALAKIEGDYAGNHSRIGDLVRGRIVADTPEQIDLIRQYMQERRAELGVERSKDRFASPSDTHFRDINSSIRLPNGHVAEFRVEHRGLLEASKYTHEPYERVQEIERRAQAENRLMTSEEAAQRARILDGVRDTHDAASSRAGLDTLLSQPGREKLENHAQERLTREQAHPSPSAERISAPSPDTPHGSTAHPVQLPNGGRPSLLREFGSRAGFVGGLIVGGAVGTVMAVNGASAGEVAQGVAETAIPGASSAIAASEGRVAEGTFRLVEEVPLAGLIVTEIARPFARAAGMDVDPSILQQIGPAIADSARENRNDAQRKQDTINHVRGMSDKDIEAAPEGIRDHLTAMRDAISVRDQAAQRLAEENGRPATGRVSELARLRNGLSGADQRLSNFYDDLQTDPEGSGQRLTAFLEQQRAQQTALAGRNVPQEQSPSPPQQRQDYAMAPAP